MLRGDNYFSHRLYRRHTAVKGFNYVKDISLIGRDMSKVVIVDNLPTNILPQKQNGILIKPFYGCEADDEVLKYLEVILSKVYYENCSDIRQSLLTYKEDILKYVSYGI